MLISSIKPHNTFQQLQTTNSDYDAKIDDSMNEERPPLKIKRKLSTEIFSKPNLDSDDSVSEKRPRFSINDLLSARDNKVSTTADDGYAAAAASTSNFAAGGTPPLAVNAIVTNSASNAIDGIIKTKNADLQKSGKLLAKTNPSTSKRYIRPENIVVPPNYVPNGNSQKLAKIRCMLEADNQLLWSRFNKIGTEMIITKPGRRMFPTIKVRLENCDANANYYVYLDTIPVDAKRYRYVYSKSAWCCSGKADRTPPNRLYVHPDSPFSGGQMQLHTISFEKAKLTNNESDNRGHLVLNSMHKYQPRLHILRRERTLPFLENGGQGINLCAPAFRDSYRTFHFGETQFMAVTAYQNQLVTEMKIAMNPFAKGFRDHGNRGDSASDFIDVIGETNTQMNLCSIPLSYPLDVSGENTASTTQPSGIEPSPLFSRANLFNSAVNGVNASLTEAYSTQVPSYAHAFNTLFPNYFRGKGAAAAIAATAAITMSSPTFPAVSQSSSSTRLTPPEMLALAFSWQEHMTRQRVNSFFLQQQQQQNRQSEIVQSEAIEQSEQQNIGSIQNSDVDLLKDESPVTFECTNDDIMQNIYKNDDIQECSWQSTFDRDQSSCRLSDTEDNTKDDFIYIEDDDRKQLGTKRVSSENEMNNHDNCGISSPNCQIFPKTKQLISNTDDGCSTNFNIKCYDNQQQ